MSKKDSQRERERGRETNLIYLVHIERFRFFHVGIRTKGGNRISIGKTNQKPNRKVTDKIFDI